MASSPAHATDWHGLRCAPTYMRIPGVMNMMLASRLAHKSMLSSPIMVMRAAFSAAFFGGLEHSCLQALEPSTPDDVYVVSSSSRGIGLEFARQLLHRTSGHIVGLARDPDASVGMAALEEAYPGRFTAIKCDTTQQSSVADAGGRIAQISGGRVDLLLNVAGILGDGRTPDTGPERSLSGISRDWLRETMEVNVIGHVMMTQALMPQLKRKRGLAHEQHSLRFSKVVNLSARVGSISDNGLGGWYSYRMSKAALNQFTKTAGLEMKRHGCVVLALHPGTTDTDLSVPFQKNVAEHKLFPVWYSCARMLDVVWGVDDADSGKFLAYDGSEIPW